MNETQTTTTAPENQPRCILQVGAGLEQGGVERGIVEMAEYLASSGWRALVASAGGNMVEQLLRVGGEHFELPLTQRNPAAIISNGFALAKIIRDAKVDVVHARSRAPAWAAILACKMTGVPLVTTFHGTYNRNFPGKTYYNSSMVRGRRVIAISEFIREHIQTYYHVPPEKIILAPRGYDPRFFNLQHVTSEQVEALWKQWEIPAVTPVILLPGRITRWKGHSEFIKALARIKNLPWKAIIVGGYGKKEGFFWELQTLVNKLGLQDRVLFEGSQNNMPLYYAASDVVVTPSLEPEAFGRTNVEAQAMGKPVISTAHGGALETVKSGETGWLVRPGNVERLALALADAITDTTRLKHMGAAGQKWVAEHFTINKMCAAEMSAYTAVLAEQGD